MCSVPVSRCSWTPTSWRWAPSWTCPVDPLPRACLPDSTTRRTWPGPSSLARVRHPIRNIRKGEAPPVPWAGAPAGQLQTRPHVCSLHAAPGSPPGVLPPPCHRVWYPPRAPPPPWSFCFCCLPRPYLSWGGAGVLPHARPAPSQERFWHGSPRIPVPDLHQQPWHSLVLGPPAPPQVQGSRGALPGLSIGHPPAKMRPREGTRQNGQRGKARGVRSAGS